MDKSIPYGRCDVVKKRLFAMLIMTTLIVASCSFSSDVPARGYWDGNTFVSAFFGLRFDMPEGWSAMSEDEMAQTLRPPGIGHVEMGEQIPQEIFDVLDRGLVNGHGFFVDMMARDEFDPAFSPMVMTAIERQPQGVLLEEGDTQRIGDHYWHFDDTYIETGQAPVNMRIFRRINDGFVKHISVVYFDDEGLRYILSHFRAYAVWDAAAPARGHWDGDTFISVYFGLRFDMPYGWFAITPERIIGLIEAGVMESAFIPSEIAPPGEVIPLEVLESTGIINDVTAFYGREATLHIDIWDLLHEDEQLFYTAEEYFDWVANFDGIFGSDTYLINTDTVGLRRLVWHVGDFNRQDSELHIRYLVNIDGRFMRRIAITAQSSSQVDEIIGHFRAY